MIEEKFNVVIVGSGFSGIVAANTLAGFNLKIVLIDENIHIGGQILRKIPLQLGEYSSYHTDKTKKIGFGFVNQIKEKKIKILNRTRILGIYPEGKILLEKEDKEVSTITFDFILFATGARERFLPFKGWTKPGVYSTGLVQVLMKSSGILCSEKILISGSGLFLYAVGYEYLKNRGKVLGIFEQSTMLDKIKFFPMIIKQFPKFYEGARYFAKIFLSGVPVKYKTKIIEARGKESLEQVVVAKVDKNGRIRAGTEKIIQTDALATGFGFVPNTELPHLAGCEHKFNEEMGGWVVEVNEQMETSVRNVFAAGEVTGIGGAFKSITEGEIAAYSILHRLEKINDSRFYNLLRRGTRQRHQHLKFGKLFNSLYKIPIDSILEIPDETIICRCEDVRMGEIKKAVKRGFFTPGALKIAVRTGMGNCQGRTCSPIVYDIITALTRVEQEKFGPFSSRPPLKPASIKSMVNFQKKI